MGDARTSIQPAPTPEEAAAIVAALEVLRSEPVTSAPVRDRWRLAGLLGHPVAPGVKIEGSLWSYSSWKGGL